LLDPNGNGWFYAVDGLYTIVFVGSTLAQIDIVADQALVTSSAGGVTLQANGVALSNQALLNIVQGSNITVAANGGNITISGTAAAVQFKVNGTAASSQTVQNLIAGTGTSIVDGGGGNITFSSTSGTIEQVNGTPTSDQTVANFISGPGIAITNPSGGIITIVGTPVYMGSSTPLTAPSIQCGAATLAAGTVTVTLPVAYTSSSTFVVQATLVGAGAAYPVSAQTLTSTTFSLSAYGTSGQVASVAVTSNELTIVSNTNYAVGQQISFSGVGTATFLNGQTVTLDSANGNTFTAPFTNANYGPTADTGSIISINNASGSVYWITVGN
jgi:hypothetical protein